MSTIYPITLQQVKEQIRRFGDDLDSHLQDLITEAFDYVQTFTSIRLTTKSEGGEETTTNFITVSDLCDVSEIIDGKLNLRKHPVASFESIEILNGDSSTVFSEENYWVFLLDDRSQIQFKNLPEQSQPYGIRLNYTAGLESIPGQMRAAMLLYVTWRFRSDESPMPPAIHALLNQVKIWRL